MNSHQHVTDLILDVSKQIVTSMKLLYLQGRCTSNEEVRLFPHHHVHTHKLRLSHGPESTTTSSSRSLLSHVHYEWVMVCLCVNVFFCPGRSDLFEVMRMGWERRTDGESVSRGVNSLWAPPDFSELSELSNTSVQGPATSIMIPAGCRGRHKHCREIHVQTTNDLLLQMEGKKKEDRDLFTNKQKSMVKWMKNK